MREIELRMYGQADPPGELRADAAARVGEALQDVILRLTREAANAAGLGRPPRVLEQLGEVRLAGVTQGSTRLIFRLGDPSALDVDPLSGATDRMFTELVTGIAQNRRPAFVTETIAEATARFVASLQKASPQTDVTLSGRTVARLETGRVDRTVWQQTAGPVQEATLVGQLEDLDLHRDHFRLRDDVGNRIELDDVANSDEAASLGGQRVIAPGLYRRASGAGRSRLSNSTVRPFEASPWLAAPVREQVSDATSGYLRRFPEDLAPSEPEMDDFLTAIHG